ncbi:MAG: ATP-binding protein [Anaerolineales bacterium]|jgi:two-component system phosphate regulon sensor histidine kinase PhoR
MNWFLPAVIIILVLALGVLAWRHVILRRRLSQYASIIRRVADEGQPVTDLPKDAPGVEELSNAVTQLAQAELERTSKAETERARLATVLERMTDGVLIADADGRVRFSNPAAGRLFESPDPDGRTVAEVLRHYKLVEAWRRCQQDRELLTESVELPNRRLFLQLVAIPDQDTGGSLLLVQDLTRVRRLETVRRDFVSNLSHELRTPLASLKALTETLRGGALEDPKAATHFLESIETEVDAMTQMAGELLELTRIESGQLPLEFKPVPAGDLLLSAAERMRAQVERAGLTLRLDSPQVLTEVRADPPRLEQVLVNLIHNAVKFTNPGGEVVLSAQAEPGFVRFSVQDTGVGIPADDLERIFERFYKADRARSSGGTGLGLSIARHVVEAHGGKIWAESVEGRGSTFKFTIPVAL